MPQEIGNILPEGLAQSIQQPYIQNGLTYQSNNKFVMQRDTAGNIILDANAATMQHLIIEPAVEKILNKSVVEVFDTRFNYFKFPAKSKVIPKTAFTLNIDLDTDAPVPDVIEEVLQDLISGHYVAPPIEDGAGLPLTITRHRLSSDPDSTWTLAGSGKARIPFSFPITGPMQIEPGTFTITPEIIATLQETNSTIKFRAYLASNNRDTAVTQYMMQLIRTMPTEWRSRTVANGWPLSPSGQELYDSSTPPDLTKFSAAGELYVSMTLDYIIHPDDFREFDKYEIVAWAGRPSWWNRAYSYWDIDVIPDPGSGYGLQWDYDY
jgi:hypothetical protein